MKKLAIYWIVTLCVNTSVNGSDGPCLSIPQRIHASFGEPVVVPIEFTGKGAEISALLFSVDFDESCLSLDDRDADADGRPDDILFSIPAQFTGAVTFEPEDLDGELDFVIADFGPPLLSLPDGEIAFIIFTPTCQPARTSLIAHVSFSTDPSASFGDVNGQGVEGCTVDGSIEIFPDGEPEIFTDGFESGDTTAWSSTVTGT